VSPSPVLNLPSPDYKDHNPDLKQAEDDLKKSQVDIRPEPLEIGDDTEEEPYTEEMNEDSIEILCKKPIIEKSNLDSPSSKKRKSVDSFQWGIIEGFDERYIQSGIQEIEDSIDNLTEVFKNRQAESLKTYRADLEILIKQRNHLTRISEGPHTDNFISPRKFMKSVGIYSYLQGSIPHSNDDNNESYYAAHQSFTKFM